MRSVHDKDFQFSELMQNRHTKLDKAAVTAIKTGIEPMGPNYSR